MDGGSEIASDQITHSFISCGEGNKRTIYQSLSCHRRIFHALSYTYAFCAALVDREWAIPEREKLLDAVSKVAPDDYASIADIIGNTKTPLVLPASNIYIYIYLFIYIYTHIHIEHMSRVSRQSMICTLTMQM